MEATAVVTNTESNSSTATMAELTFLIRQAPSRSALAGKLVAEIKCANTVSITLLLKQYDLWDDIVQLEAARYRTKGGTLWKTFKFIAPPHVYRVLHELCSPSDVEELAKLTDAHLAKMSVVPARKQLMRLKNAELAEYAQLIPGYENTMTKKAMVDLIINAVDQAPLAGAA